MASGWIIDLLMAAVPQTSETACHTILPEPGRRRLRRVRPILAGPEEQVRG